MTGHANTGALNKTMDLRAFVTLALAAIVITGAGRLLRLLKPVRDMSPWNMTEDVLTLRLAKTATALTIAISGFVAPVGNIWVTRDARIGVMFMVMGASLAFCTLLPILVSLPFQSVRAAMVWRVMARASRVSDKGLAIGWVGIAAAAFATGAVIELWP